MKVINTIKSFFLKATRFLITILLVAITSHFCIPALDNYANGVNIFSQPKLSSVEIAEKKEILETANKKIKILKDSTHKIIATKDSINASNTKNLDKLVTMLDVVNKEASQRNRDTVYINKYYHTTDTIYIEKIANDTITYANKKEYNDSTKATRFYIRNTNKNSKINKYIIIPLDSSLTKKRKLGSK